MSRPSRRQPSDSSGSDDDSDYARRQSVIRTRRAMSTSSGRGRRPQLADLAEYQSYHRPSSERRYVPTKDPDSDSESSDDSYSAHRQHRRRARSPSAAPSTNYRPPSRARSVDHHHHHRRRRSPSPPSRRRPASTFPIAPRDHHNTDRSSRHYPPSASHSHYPPSTSRSGRAHSSSRSHRDYRHDRNSSPSARSHRSHRDHSPSSRSPTPSDPPEKPQRKNSDIFLGAARTAFTAGAIAALKLHDDDSPWLGPKGAKIVTAGLSAAAVDTIMEKKHPCRKGGLRHSMMRQATQLVIGNLVMRPAKKAEAGDMGGRIQGKMGEGARGLYNHAGHMHHHKK